MLHKQIQIYLGPNLYSCKKMKAKQHILSKAATSFILFISYTSVSYIPVTISGLACLWVRNVLFFLSCKFYFLNPNRTLVNLYKNQLCLLGSLLCLLIWSLKTKMCQPYCAAFFRAYHHSLASEAELDIWFLITERQKLTARIFHKINVRIFQLNK